MMLPYAKTLINDGAINAVIEKVYEVQYNNSEVENANNPEAWWTSFNGELTAPGTLDAKVENDLPTPDSGTYVVAGGSKSADMTQVVAVGPTNAKRELKYNEAISGRIKVTVTPSGAIGAKATILLQSNRPFTIKEVV